MEISSTKLADCKYYNKNDWYTKNIFFHSFIHIKDTPGKNLFNLIHLLPDSS